MEGACVPSPLALGTTTLGQQPRPPRFRRAPGCVLAGQLRLFLRGGSATPLIPSASWPLTAEFFLCLGHKPLMGSLVNEFSQPVACHLPVIGAYRLPVWQRTHDVHWER